VDKDKDWAAFCVLMQGADELTVGKPRSGVALSLMFKILSCYDFGLIERAVEAHIRREKFAVTPADIIRHIEGAPEDRAKLAWQVVVHAIQRLGRYESVRFPYPAYHYAIGQMGGWQGLCISLRNEDLPFRGKDFERFFEIGERVASWDHTDGKVHVPAYLCGSHEYHNRLSGHVLPPSVKDAVTGEVLLEFRNALPPQGEKTLAIVKSPAKGMKAS
jgi:hypothetical protein